MNGLRPMGAIKASTAILLCCAMLLLGGAAGYSMGMGQEQAAIEAPPPAEAAEPAEETPAAAQVAQRGEETVSPNAQVIWQNQMCCGHTVEVESAQPIIGKTRAELEREYGADAILEFSPEKVTIAREMDLFCPEHYVLKLESGLLTVRKTGEDLKEEILLTLDVSLPPDAAAECTEGLPFDSLEDINLYLEGLDS